MSGILIIAGGPLARPFGLDYVKNTEWDFLIAADAGLSFCREAGLMPDLIMGDFDSADSDDFQYYYKRMPERFVRFPVHKDYTDLDLALQEAYKRPEPVITVLGALGGRLDHTLGNVGLLKQALSHGRDCRLIDEKNRVRMVCGRTVLKKAETLQGNLSLIAYDGPVTGLTLRGFAYDVTGFTLHGAVTRGISNEIVEETATIDLQDGFLLVIESTD